MRELQRPRRAVIDHRYLSLDGLADQVEHLRDGLPRRGREIVECESRADDGSHLQQVVARVGQPSQALFDHGPHTCWHLKMAGGSPTPADQREHLAGEERIAARQPVQVRDQLRCEPFVRDQLGADEQPELVGVEPCQRQVPDATSQLNQESRHGMVWGDLVVAVGAHEHHRIVVQHPHGEPEQPNRGFVGPLQVVEHDRETFRARDPQQPGDALEQSKSRRIHRRGRPTFARQQCHHLFHRRV
jgi:hypothetical protein